MRREFPGKLGGGLSAKHDAATSDSKVEPHRGGGAEAKHDSVSLRSCERGSV